MNKILVIDDDKRIASALAVRLSAAGYEVLTASDGVQGLKAAVGQKPALIITDIWMPRPLGFLNHERMQILGLAAVQVIYITASKKKDLRHSGAETHSGGRASPRAPISPGSHPGGRASLGAPISHAGGQTHSFRKTIRPATLTD